ncbi:MAG: methyltransferase domain-containing protein, partial [Candidatus Sericytochromatia bacterium]|nr:methyltransferase domain-containing protein [Candidatus Sericytochromatia bacterium]
MIPTAIREYFCCPTCRGALTWVDDAATCPACAKRFPIDGTIVDFLETPELDPLTNRLESHYNQRAVNNATPQGEMEVWALLPAAQVKVAIDVGCGMGNKAVMLAQKAEWLICVDLARSSLELARTQLTQRGLADRTVFIVANATEMPIRDGVIDLAVCTEVIEHIEQPATLVAELHRVVKPDGALVLSAPNYANVAGMIKRSIDVLLYKGETRWSPFGVEAFERHITTFATQRTFHDEGWQID